MAEERTDLKRIAKPLSEYGPLVVFFVSYQIWGLYPATALLIGTTLAGTALCWGIERKIPMMPVITAAIVGLFGGLSLWLHDDTFIKMKPTIVQALMALALAGGALYGRWLLKHVIGAAIDLADDDWRTLTWRFVAFLTTMAVLNEVVWRTQSTDLWVSFKVFGLTGLTVVFVLSQAKLLSKGQMQKQNNGGNP